MCQGKRMGGREYLRNVGHVQTENEHKDHGVTWINESESVCEVCME